MQGAFAGGIGRRAGGVGREGGLGAVLGGQAQAAFGFPVGGEAAGHVGDGQHPIDHGRGDGRAGHGIVLGLAGVLRDGEAAAFLDALDADGPVAVRAERTMAAAWGPWVSARVRKNRSTATCRLGGRAGSLRLR